MSEKTPTQRELLIRIDERTKNLEAWSVEHKQQHLRSRLAVFGAMASALVALVVTLFRK